MAFGDKIMREYSFFGITLLVSLLAWVVAAQWQRTAVAALTAIGKRYTHESVTAGYAMAVLSRAIAPLILELPMGRHFDYEFGLPSYGRKSPLETEVVTNDSERREEAETAPLEVLYRHRFSDEDRRAKDKIWRILCTHFFSRYVAHDATVLDVGAGYCEFINYIAAKRRIAVDANPDVTRFASPGVEAFCANVANMDFLADESVDVAFSSNFFEHLPTKRALTQLTLEIRRILRPAGRLLVMGPNIACIPGKYWDYYDHHLPLTDKSVEELLHTSGYQIERSMARFLPYTFISRLPKWSWVVRAYLRLGKLTFPIFGEQFFIVARKDEHRS